MMRKIFITLGLLAYCSTAPSTELEEITEKFLCENPYTDHVQIFQQFFQGNRVNSFLEFGLGYGTKYFLDHCDKVVSYEIILPGQNEDWFQNTQHLYKNYNNWTAILKQGSHHLDAANRGALERKDPSLYNANYLLELKEICDEIFKENAIDMVLVDPGFHMRGDLVNELFDRAPIIVAHDTNHAPEIYGWNKINTPFNYEKIIFTHGQGITFWIRKDKIEIIASLKGILGESYHETPRKNLRIFFPQMHPVLVQSMALVCQHLGHTLVLPGESFDPNSAHPGLKIAYGTFFKKTPSDSLSFTSFFSNNPEDCHFLKKNIEVIENDEILLNPPDVLFVNCLQVEGSIYAIAKTIAKRTKKTLPKLAHFSGNNGSHYDPKFVKNLIAVDAYTATYYDPATTNIIFWIPWIDFENLKYEGVIDSTSINTYMFHYYDIFKTSASVFYEMVEKMKQNFPYLTINAYPIPNGGFVPHNKLFSLIESSAATLHIKESEGFGYTIIESLAKGRPVFLKRSFSLGSRLMNWCLEEKTAFFFDDYPELQSKLYKYLNDSEFRYRVQNDCAHVIRQLIDNAKQARILENFLQNLK